jgi:hypothetical protein
MDAFQHLHMPPELACEFLAVFSRMEYALKASIQYASGNADGVQANWDRFANDIDKQFLAIDDKEFETAVDYLLDSPPRKQVLKNSAIEFVDQAIDKKQAKAQQTLLMVRTVRNNLFHGGKHLPLGEKEAGRNAQLVSYSLIILRHSIPLNDLVRQHFEM